MRSLPYSHLGLPTFLYRAVDEQGGLLYVGITNNPRLRVGQHQASKTWWETEVARVDVQPYPNRALAEEAERAAILAEKPKYNLAGTPNYSPVPERKKPKPAKREYRPDAARYTARVTRDGRFWLIHVPKIDRHTQARNLGEIEPMTRDLIAIMEGVNPDSIELDIDIVMPGGADRHLARAIELRAAEAQARAEAAAEVRTAAVALKEAGIPLRDLGKLLGVSYQRAHQLVNS